MINHRTADGDIKALCEMSDNHLENTVNVLLNTAEVCKRVVESGVNKETITEIIHGVSRKQQVAQAREKIKAIYQRLPPYIMEASIRGIDFGERLREVFSREKKAEVFTLPLDFRIENLLEE